MLMRGAVFLGPERMCLILNKTGSVCWNKFLANLTFRVMVLLVARMVIRITPRHRKL
jgi:hypothetical protein